MSSVVAVVRLGALRGTCNANVAKWVPESAYFLNVGL